MKSERPNIVIIEDEESISKLICMYLEKSQINATPFYTAEEALDKLDLLPSLPNIILLDLNLPGMSGFDFLSKIKEKYSLNTPSVIILSARDSDEDVIRGLDIGADDFLTKPFSPSVLVARIQANLRRQASATAKAEESIVFDDFTLLLNSCVLKKGNTKISLSTKEYEVLEYLLKNAGETLSPEKIYQDVWKVEFGDITAVAVYIQRLRKKLESDENQMHYIKTEFGKGYIFNKECIQKHEN